MNPLPLFAASEIAPWLGIVRQSLVDSLRGSPPSGFKLVRGRPAAAWTVAALPDDIREKLERQRERRGFRSLDEMPGNNSIGGMLFHKPDVYHPEFPLAEVHPDCITFAGKLQRAQARSLAMMNDPAIPMSEIDRISIEDYRREFGYTIKARQSRKLLNRTKERAGAGEDFTRLEIYFPGQLKRRPEAAPSTSTGAKEFAELAELAAEFDPANGPTTNQRAAFWLKTFEMFDRLLKGRPADKQLRRRMLDFLWQRFQAWIAGSRHALYVQWDSRLKRWRAADGDSKEQAQSQMDGRKEKLGEKRAPEFVESDVDQIAWTAGQFWRKDVLPAARELAAEGKLTDPALISWAANGCNTNDNTYRRLLDASAARARTAYKFALDPNAAWNDRVRLTLNNIDEPSMRGVSVDDFTLGVKFRVPDGKGWWRLTRGQVIMVADSATYCVLSFGLQEEESPNSLISRTALTTAFERWGVPEILTVERGQIFADSNLVTGGKKAKKVLAGKLPWSDSEVSLGLRRFCRVTVSQGPQSKPIERVGDLVQALMAGEKGYTGIEEKRDCPHDTILWATELERGNPEALEHFYTLEEWRRRLHHLVFEVFNKKVHGPKSRKIPGLSPIEAFKQRWPHDDPPTPFPNELRYLLAHHRIDNVRVTGQGIQFYVRGKLYRYFGKESGHWETHVGKRVIAWLDPEAPTYCIFTDSKMRNPFRLELHTNPKPHTYDETFGHEMAKARAHANEGKRYYDYLKAQPWATFRRVVATPATVELGRHIEQEAVIEKKRQRQSAVRAKNIQTLGRECGVPDVLLRNDPATERAAELFAEAEKEAESE